MMIVSEAMDYALEVGALSDAGTGREHNEDWCGALAESCDCAIAAVADGVSSSSGGEVASRMAIEVLLRAYGEEAPNQHPGQRLYRAVQQANIEVYDRAIAVPELHGMATTLTAVAVWRGELTAVHVGDSRLYLVRERQATQLTRDHTVAAEKARYGLISQERLRNHEDRCVLTRSVGRELIVNRDRTARQLVQGDALLICSDGLYNVLDDAEMASILGSLDAASACRALVSAANERGTPDNVTAVVVRLVGATPQRARPNGVGARLRRFFDRSA